MFPTPILIYMEIYFIRFFFEIWEKICFHCNAQVHFRIRLLQFISIKIYTKICFCPFMLYLNKNCVYCETQVHVFVLIFYVSYTDTDSHANLFCSRLKINHFRDSFDCDAHVHIFVVMLFYASYINLFSEQSVLCVIVNFLYKCY